MEIFMSVLVCFLAAYGTFQILFNFAVSFSTSNKIKMCPGHQLIIIKDDCESLEAYLRSVEMKIEDGDLVILLNCSEDTNILKLLEILEGSFAFVRVMMPEEYIEYTKGLCSPNFE